MKKLLGSAAALALVPTLASAVGLDRSGQGINPLFEEGGYLEFSLAHVRPDIDGNDVALLGPGGIVANPGGQASGDVADNFFFAGAALKFDITQKISLALIIDDPYGSDINYSSTGSVNLGGTQAIVDSNAITAVARYKFNDNFSVHGGLRWQTIDANVTLSGAAFGGLNGYNADLEGDGDLGFVVGAAYEIPRIALRLSATYFSGTDHQLETTETIGGIPANLIVPGFAATSTTEVDTPEAINVEFQTGINQRTLLFGSLRYAWYDDVVTSPDLFDALVNTSLDGSPTSGDSLTSIDSGIAYNIGVGRKLTEKLSGSVSFGLETADDDLVSPLAPTNGSWSVAAGLSYDVSEAFNISGGVRYTDLGNSEPETGTPDTARAEFDGNDALSFGLKLAYRF